MQRHVVRDDDSYDKPDGSAVSAFARGDAFDLLLLRGQTVLEWGSEVARENEVDCTHDRVRDRGACEYCGHRSAPEAVRKARTLLHFVDTIQRIKKRRCLILTLRCGYLLARIQRQCGVTETENEPSTSLT